MPCACALSCLHIAFPEGKSRTPAGVFWPAVTKSLYHGIREEKNKVLLKDFDYVLPEELIAQYPLDRRDRSRLLVLERENNRLHHVGFAGLPAWCRRLFSLSRTSRRDRSRRSR